jgi:hypothetical protein
MVPTAADEPSSLKDSPRASLKLIELIAATRESGYKVAATYYLETPRHRLFEKRSVSAGFTAVVIPDVPGHAGVTLKARLMLPGLSERGSEFVARNEIHMSLSEEELAALVKGARVVKAFYFPNDAPDARGSNLKAVPLTPGVSQRRFLSEINGQGDLIAVLELTARGTVKVD